MLTQQHLSQSQIDWSRITEVDFNALVEVLLIKLHSQPPYKVDVVRGHGGDTGLDVVVWLDEKAWRIYQLKYFPGGMSGGLVQRRQQVNDSFNTAWKYHQPTEWILVIPEDPHANEIAHVKDLAADKAVKVEIWGQKKLTAALSDFPELETAFTKNEMLELLVKMVLTKDGDDNSENAVLGVSSTDNRNNSGYNLMVQNTGGIDAEDVTLSITTDDSEFPPSIVSPKPALITAKGNWMFKLNWSSASTNNLLVSLAWTQNGLPRTATQSISVTGVQPTRVSKTST
jgi:hypothetical protein